jgi:hypothetical protein
MSAGKRLLRLSLYFAGLLALVSVAWSQPPEYEAHPRDFVRAAIYNELHAQAGGEHYMFKDIDKKPKANNTKLMIETKQATISRVIAIDGRPLNAQERAQDDGRVNRLMNDPSALRKKQQEQKEDEAHEQKLLSSIPDAFNFTFAGVQDAPSGKLVRYTFQPDPNFSPPNHESRVFQGMKGEMLIDIDAKRIAKIDATLFQPVDFGWGILGRLDRGGRFLIEQRCLDGKRWETTHSVLHFTGKALMLKAISIQEDETLSDFRRVGDDLTIAQGIETLRKADEVVAQNGGGTGQK